MENNYVPIFTSLSEVYDTDLDSVNERFAKIKTAFAESFESEPEWFVRSPGRVNLIGEHIDYEGYAVFPMAIAQDTVVAIRKAGDDLKVANLNKENYPTYTFSIDPSQSVDVASSAWTNYFLAAYKGVFEFFKKEKSIDLVPCGLQVFVDGCVPTGSGLSSSSALVCSSAIAILTAHNVLKQVTQSELAEFTCWCERYSGTESGGMDQAISIMAKTGFAKLIEFNPVRGTDVSFPSSALFIVANSLAVSNKAETAAERYNLRVVECRMAAMMIGHALGLPQDKIKGIKMLKEIQDLEDLYDKAASVFGTESIKSRNASSICEEIVRKSLEQGVYQVAEVEAILGFSVEDVFQDSPNGLNVLNSLKQTESGLQLRNRAVHVFKEADRVLKMKEICEDPLMEEPEKLVRIGRCMNESHESCRDLYECSCPELEELVEDCNKNGAMGCRLTGAGWGGCVVALIDESQKEPFIAAIKKDFYAKRIQDGIVNEDDLDRCIFASKPSTGAGVLGIQF